MKLSFFIDASIVVLLSFFVRKKKLPLLENLFILMIVEFLITSYCAILYINIDVWEVTNDLELFIIFRMYEAILNPLIWLWYFNLLPSMVSRFSKWVLTFLLVGIQYGVEQWLVLWDVITYKDWHYWQSLMIHILVLVIITLSFLWYRTILQKEGYGTK